MNTININTVNKSVSGFQPDRTGRCKGIGGAIGYSISISGYWGAKQIK